MFLCRRHSERDECYHEFLSRLWLFVIDKPESWLFWLGRSAFSASSKVLVSACCFHFGSFRDKQTKNKQRYSARAQRSAPPRPELQSVTDKDAPRKLSAPHQSLPNQSSSPWQIKVPGESSVLRATLLRTSPSPTKVAVHDRQRYSARAQRSPPREECVPNISPLTRGNDIFTRKAARWLVENHCFSEFKPRSWLTTLRHEWSSCCSTSR